MVILGIDPGSTRVGYGLIQKTGNEIKFLEAGLLKIRKVRLRETLSEGDQSNLLEIKRQLEKLFKKWRPEIMAVEKLYFVKNQKTALGVAQARGAIVLSALENNLPIKEYTPNEVKAGITGYGLADKKSVAKMVKLILNEPTLKVIDDASDALALAIMASNSKS